MDKRTLVLYFQDEENKVFPLRIDDPLDDIDGPKAKAAMQTIIQGDIYERKLVGQQKVELITTTIQELSIE